MAVALTDIFTIGVRFQQFLYNCGVHASSVGDVGQNLMISDITSLDKVGIEQGIDYGVLFAFNACPVDQPMRIQRIGGLRFMPSKSILRPAFSACSTTGA